MSMTNYHIGPHPARDHPPENAVHRPVTYRFSTPIDDITCIYYLLRLVTDVIWHCMFAFTSRHCILVRFSIFNYIVFFILLAFHNQEAER